MIKLSKDGVVEIRLKRILEANHYAPLVESIEDVLELLVDNLESPFAKKHGVVSVARTDAGKIEMEIDPDADTAEELQFVGADSE